MNSTSKDATAMRVAATSETIAIAGESVYTPFAPASIAISSPTIASAPSEINASIVVLTAPKNILIFIKHLFL